MMTITIRSVLCAADSSCTTAVFTNTCAQIFVVCRQLMLWNLLATSLSLLSSHMTCHDRYVDPHPFTVALYHLQWLPVLCVKGGEEICHLLLFYLSALRCCIIRRHTVGSVRVRNSSLFVQQRLKHVPVHPHRPCGTSRDDVHAICCLFACCCFIVSYNQ